MPKLTRFWSIKPGVGKRTILQRLFRHFPNSHHLLLALLFFVGLELISTFHRWIIALSFILIAVLGWGIVLIRVEEQRFRLIQAILPVLAATGLTGFSFFLSAGPLRHLYFAAAALTFFWLLKHGARQAYPTWNWSISTVVLFLNLAVILGTRAYLFTSMVTVVGLIFLITFLISFQAFQRIVPTKTNTLLLALALALVLTQLAWALQFLPANYLILSGTLVVAYYVAFHVTSLSFERPLHREDITEYAAIGAAALLLLLLTARWT